MSDHPHTMSWFSKERKEIVSFVKKLKVSMEAKKRLLLVIAQVKAGKKEIVECIKLEYPDFKAYYITSLNRKDVKNQQEELAKYEIETYVVNSDGVIDDIIEEVNEYVKKGTTVIFFWDECDYGSGKTQKLNRLFAPFMDTKQIIHILISATPQETLFSSLIQRSDFATLTFTPPDEYKGAQYFLENNLVFIPKPFLQKSSDIVPTLTFTAHAFEVIRSSFTPQRNIGAIRITGRALTLDIIRAQLTKLEGDVNRHFNGGMHGRSFSIKVIDAKDGLNWEDPLECHTYKTYPRNWLFMFNQTCTRGTDLKGWHTNIAFWHDARSCSSCNLNTLLQAILRPAHYSSCYMSNEAIPTATAQAIRLYVDKPAVKAATGDYTEYGKAKGKAPTRTTVPRVSAEYETHEATVYDSLKPYFTTISQVFPSIESFPKKGEFYTPGQTLGINEEDRSRDVWDYTSAKKLKFQQNRLHHYYIIPSYKDLTNANSLVWVITRKLTSQEKGKDAKNVFKATHKSMYEG